MVNFTPEERRNIVDCYLYNNMSIRAIRTYFYPDKSVSSIRRLLLRYPEARKLMNRRAVNRKDLDDFEVFTTYQKQRSLRKTARKFNVTPSTVREHVLKYQKTHNVKPLIKEKGDSDGNR